MIPPGAFYVPNRYLRSFAAGAQRDRTLDPTQAVT
jgi:hypothetical protein